MSGRLENKTILVTGGGSGIGRATCKLFAREGARLAVVDSNLDGAEETVRLLTGSGHCSIKADVRNSDEVKQAFEVAEKNFGKKCDVVVNNAGVLGKKEAVADISTSDFDQIVDVNLKGVFLVAKEYLNSVKSVGRDVRGVLINMSSLAAHMAPADFGAYSASKAAIVALTKTIANEFSIHRVRSNAVKPAFVDTPLYRDIDQEYKEAIVKAIPLQRVATVEEVANSLLFLASDESSYVHGTCLELSGGL